MNSSGFTVKVENNEVTVNFDGVTTTEIIQSIVTLMSVVQQEDTDMDKVEFAKFITELFLDEDGELEEVDSEEALLN